MLTANQWRYIALVLAAIALAYALPSLLRRRSVSPPNLLLISVDTLRADHLSCYDYPRPTSPNVDRLAEQGVLFERFVSPRGLTHPALATLMTGQECHHHGVRYNFQLPRHSTTLAQILRDEGYLCRAYLSNAGNFVRLGFDDQSVGANFPDHTEHDRKITRLGVEFLQERARGSRQPFFLWLHYMSPHAYYEPPAPWDRGLDGTCTRSSEYYKLRLDDYMAERADLSTDGTLEEIINYYDGCVAFVDSLVGHVFETLDAQGLGEDTLVVFTADHGEELYEHHHYFLHQLSMYDATLHIPLILRWKGRTDEGRRIPLQLGLVDLMPTILDLLGVEWTHDMDGQSFGHLAGTESEVEEQADAEAVGRQGQLRPILIEMIRDEGCAYGVYQHPFKYIFLEQEISFVKKRIPSSIEPEPVLVYPTEQLFDLADDPKEARNLFRQEPGMRDAMKQLVDEHLLAFADCLHDRFPDMSYLNADRLKQLDEEMKGLGYIGPGQVQESRQRATRPTVPQP